MRKWDVTYDANDGVPRWVRATLTLAAKLTRRSWFFYLNEENQRRIWFGRFDP